MNVASFVWSDPPCAIAMNSAVAISTMANDLLPSSKLFARSCSHTHTHVWVSPSYNRGWKHVGMNENAYVHIKIRHTFSNKMINVSHLIHNIWGHVAELMVRTFVAYL